MRFKHSFLSIAILFILIIFSLSIFIKGYRPNDILTGILLSLIIFFLPLVLSLLIALFKRKLFHPFYWFFSFLMFAFIMYLKYRVPSDLLPYQRESFFINRHFSSKAGLFTTYSPVVIFRQNVDSNADENSGLVKCIYRLGSKKLSNYYIGKVQVDSNYNILNEIYNQPAIDDTILLRKEFGRTLEKMIGIERVLKDIGDQE
jgi:hypothetical protein